MTTATITTTANPRPGRRFQPTHELALAEDALDASRSLPGAHRGVVVVHEMVGPLGIPDLTVMVGDRGKLDRRLCCEVEPLLNQVDAAVVAVASAHRAHTASALAARLGWPLDAIAGRVQGLVRRGALVQLSPGRYVRRREIEPLGRLYAIEAKVKDHGAALHQARTYRVWADSYVIVMGPLGDAPLRAILGGVTADRGGLMVGGQWRCRPVIRRVDPARRLWAAEHFVAAVRGPNYQPSV